MIEPVDHPQPPNNGATRRRRHGHRRVRTRRFAILTAGLVAVALGAAAFLFVAFRYLPALDEARGLRADLVTISSRIQSAGLGIDRTTLDGVNHDLKAARQRLGRIEDLLRHDPLIAIAAAFPPTAADVRGANAVVAAARDLLDAADQGLSIGSRFVEIKQAQATGPGTDSTLAQLVELMATSQDTAKAAKVDLDRARDQLAAVPSGLAAPVEEARSAMAERLDRYMPLLDSYLTASERLPAILGWDGPRRYLVLTQNPAELRPTGGFTGSYGIIAFDRGRMTERTFRDVFLLDLPWDFPFIKPPAELADYLLGPDQPWQLADANWSPDFPTSARDALRLYSNESGDTRIDGVLAISTYSIDQILEVTGPITVPEFEATIAAGETTLKTLQLTRVAKPGENRKAFLSAFAERLFDALLGLPPSKWADLLGRADSFRTQRLLLAWFKDDAAESLATRGGFDGAVRQDAGDYVYPVDSNVAPVSKLNAIVARSLNLQVVIDAFGNARNTLDVTWENPINTDLGAAYRKLPTQEDQRILGMYFRVLVPERSRVESVSGGSFVKLTTPAVVGEEAGRTAIGTYLMVPPGRTTLRYVWTSPYAADSDETGGLYRLTIQKQPGLLPGPLTVNIAVAEGFRIASASGDLEIQGDTATFSTTFEHDVELDLRYASNLAAP